MGVGINFGAGLGGLGSRAFRRLVEGFLHERPFLQEDIYALVGPLGDFNN